MPRDQLYRTVGRRNADFLWLRAGMGNEPTCCTRNSSRERYTASNNFSAIYESDDSALVPWNGYGATDLRALDQVPEVRTDRLSAPIGIGTLYRRLLTQLT